MRYCYYVYNYIHSVNLYVATYLPIVVEFHCFRKSGIKELGAYVIAVQISGHATFSKQVPVSLVFKLLPVRLHTLLLAIMSAKLFNKHSS